MERRKRPEISYSVIKITAIVQSLVGSGLLILSGVILFSLPSIIFWLCLLLGLYFFIPGVVITFSLVSRRASQSWAKMMIPAWRWFT